MQSLPLESTQERSTWRAFCIYDVLQYVLCSSLLLLCCHIHLSIQRCDIVPRASLHPPLYSSRPFLGSKRVLLGRCRQFEWGIRAASFGQRRMLNQPRSPARRRRFFYILGSKYKASHFMHATPNPLSPFREGLFR